MLSMNFTILSLLFSPFRASISYSICNLQLNYSKMYDWGKTIDDDCSLIFVAQNNSAGEMIHVCVVGTFD